MVRVRRVVRNCAHFLGAASLIRRHGSSRRLSGNASVTGTSPGIFDPIGKTNVPRGVRRVSQGWRLTDRSCRHTLFRSRHPRERRARLAIIAKVGPISDPFLHTWLYVNYKKVSLVWEKPPLDGLYVWERAWVFGQVPWRSGSVTLTAPLQEITHSFWPEVIYFYGKAERLPVGSSYQAAKRNSVKPAHPKIHTLLQIGFRYISRILWIFVNIFPK